MPYDLGRMRFQADHFQSYMISNFYEGGHWGGPPNLLGLGAPDGLNPALNINPIELY